MSHLVTISLSNLRILDVALKWWRLREISLVEDKTSE